MTAKKPASRVRPVKAKCHDCGLPYGDPGFPDLIIPLDAWKRISPTGDEGGLLCPNCINARLIKAGIKCEGCFMSGPIESIPRHAMWSLRMVENILEREKRRDVVTPDEPRRRK